MNLAELIQRPTWMADANCKGADPDLFFPGRGDPAPHAKEVCRACDVQAECLTYAINNGERSGIWGGTDGMERRAIRRRFGFGRVNEAECGTTSGYQKHRLRGEATCDDCREAANAANRRRRGAA